MPRAYLLTPAAGITADCDAAFDTASCRRFHACEITIAAAAPDAADAATPATADAPISSPIAFRHTMFSPAYAITPPMIG